MTLERMEVIEAVEVAIKGTLAHNNIAAVTAVFFDGGRVHGYDLDKYASAPLKTDFKGGVVAKPFLTFLQSLTSDKVAITLDGTTLSVGFDKTTAKFPAFELQDMAPIEFPADTNKPFSLDSQRFSSIMRYCAAFVSKDETRRILTGIHVISKDGNVFAEATDGRRLARLHLGTSEDAFGFILTPVLIGFLAKEKITHINLCKNYVAFSCESGAMYAGRYIDGEYPNALQVIPELSSAHKVTFPEDIIQRLKRIAGLGLETVTLTITETDCTLTSAVEGSVAFSDAFEVAATAPVTVSFNIKYLLPILTASDILYFTDGNSPFAAKYMGGTLVLMPLRIN